MSPVHAEDAVGSRVFATLRERLAGALPTLPDKPEEDADTTLRALWHLACGNALSAEAAALQPLPALGAQAGPRLDALIARRLAGVPLAHLTGRQRFLGIEMLAGPEALIPRRETELLGRAAVGLLREIAQRVEQPVVVDVCTGSGNLGLALALAVPAARVTCSDLSESCVALARGNAGYLGIAPRVSFAQGDLFEPFLGGGLVGRTDLLVCNPPYISSARVQTMPREIIGFEPRAAFDGGPLGIAIVQRLIREAPAMLGPRGWLAMEVGLGQGPAVLARIQRSGAFDEVRPVLDAQDNVRALTARRASINRGVPPGAMP